MSAGLPLATQALMGAMSPIGGVLTKRLPSGKTRFVLDFGWRDGKRLRLFSVPGPGGRPLPFESSEAAQRVLAVISAQVRSGKALDAILAECRGRAAPVDAVERHLATYLEHYRAQVTAGTRSTNSIREIERYAAPGGHLDYWLGRDIRSIGYGQIEDWHLKLATGGLGPKTIRNVSGVLKAFLRWMEKRSELEKVPTFPPIAVPEYAPRIISIEDQRRILDAIDWPRRGAFLAAATEALRVSEIRALSLDDWDGQHLVVARAVQGRKVDATIKHTKNRSAVRREPWDEEFRRWLDWRLVQATPAARLRGEVALCWNPEGDNGAKRWSVPALRRAWEQACDAAGVPRVSFQQGTRHATITALAQVLPERVLRDFTRHRDPASLSHYAKPTAAPEAIVRALRPGRRPGKSTRSAERTGAQPGTPLPDRSARA